MFVLKEKDYGLGIGKQHSLIKATVNSSDQRSTFCEIRLEPGTYKLIVDVENPESSHIQNLETDEFDTSMSPEEKLAIKKNLRLPRSYDLILHSTRDLFKLKDLVPKVSNSVMMETFSNLAIQRGSIHPLNEDNSLRRYIFQSSKIGICIFTYANRSSQTYSTVEKMGIRGDFTASKNIENGKLRISLPSNSKKFVVFRFEDVLDGQEDDKFKIEVTESSSTVRK